MNINNLSQNMNDINHTIYSFLAYINEKTHALFIDDNDLKGTLNKPFRCIKKPIKSLAFDIPKRASLGCSYLTKKEIICLSLLKDSLSYKEIAKQMHVSSRTIECFLYNPQKRLGLTSVNQLLYLFKNDAILSNLKVINSFEDIG
ncbi:MAG: helix-turn-helix transcriptional regulator [Pseudomonadota bacterium]